MVKGALLVVSLEIAFIAGISFAIKHNMTANKPADMEADDA